MSGDFNRTNAGIDAIIEMSKSYGLQIASPIDIFLSQEDYNSYEVYLNSHINTETMSPINLEYSKTKGIQVTKKGFYFRVLPSPNKS